MASTVAKQNMFEVWPEGRELPRDRGALALEGLTLAGSARARSRGLAWARSTLRACGKTWEGRWRPMISFSGLIRHPSIRPMDKSRQASMARPRNPPNHAIRTPVKMRKGIQKSKLERTAHPESSHGSPWSRLKKRKTCWSREDATCAIVGH